MRKALNLAVTAWLLFGSGFLRAGDEKSEMLPAPTKVPLDCPSCQDMPGFPLYSRVNAYDVWQYYGVDRQGQFRLRVIYSPYGPYYLVNGVPYLYAPVKQLDFMPYVVD